MQLIKTLVIAGMTLVCMKAADGQTRPAVVKAGATSQPALFLISGCREGDQVVADVKGDSASLDVRSKGIGQAVIERVGERWPEHLMLKVHLRGLEYFSISCGGQNLKISVSSGSGSRRLLTVEEGGKPERDVPKTSPLWTDVRVLNGKGEAVDGLPTDGWFEMTVPAALLKDKGKLLELSWIDFYR